MRIPAFAAGLTMATALWLAGGGEARAQAGAWALLTNDQVVKVEQQIAEKLDEYVRDREILEFSKTFAGTASDGKFYPSSSAVTRFKVGSGGKITITAFHGGQLWGSTPTSWNPATYVYEFGVPPR